MPWERFALIPPDREQTPLQPTPFKKNWQHAPKQPLMDNPCSDEEKDVFLCLPQTVPLGLLTRGRETRRSRSLQPFKIRLPDGLAFNESPYREFDSCERGHPRVHV